MVLPGPLLLMAGSAGLGSAFALMLHALGTRWQCPDCSIFQDLIQTVYR